MYQAEGRDKDVFVCNMHRLWRWKALKCFVACIHIMCVSVCGICTILQLKSGAYFAGVPFQWTVQMLWCAFKMD